MNNERLIFRREFKDGRVLAINSWPGGSEELVYPSMAAFNRAKKSVEQDGKAPVISGYTVVAR